MEMIKKIEISGEDVINILQKLVEKKYPGEKISSVRIEFDGVEGDFDLKDAHTATLNLE